MSIATIPQAIARGDVSIYLAANDNSIGEFFGGRIDSPNSPITIAMVTDALRWGYNGGSSAQTDASLRATANYLIWLTGMYGQQAEAILQGSGGGSVIPPGGVTTNDWPLVVTALDFEVDGVTLNNPQLVGVQLYITVANFNQEELFAPTWFTYTSTGIVLNGINANDFAEITIQRYFTLT